MICEKNYRSRSSQGKPRKLSLFDSKFASCIVRPSALIPVRAPCPRDAEHSRETKRRPHTHIYIFML